MNLKEKIIKILDENGTMTQASIAKIIYGDNNHSNAIYSALISLVNNKEIKKAGKYPALFKSIKKSTKIYRDVTNDVINDNTIEEAEIAVINSPNYGPEVQIVYQCLRRFPLNNDPEIVILKMGLIDITNSTHLSQHKSRINMLELATIISNIPNIDERIASGDPEVVNEIARSNGKINLFSFASKYCSYHNESIYGRDDYSIIDTVLKEYLPRYFTDITKGQIQKWQDSLNYREYNDYITRKLDELDITCTYRKRKFDHFIWYKNRTL